MSGSAYITIKLETARIIQMLIETTFKTYASEILKLKTLWIWQR